MGGVVRLKPAKDGTMTVRNGSARRVRNLLGVVCVESEMALVRCGTCCSSCVSDGLAQEQDASAPSDAGVETFLLHSRQRTTVHANVTTDFEEMVIKNTFRVGLAQAR